MSFSFKIINASFCLVLSVGVFSFLAYKAERTSFTHDESYSLVHFTYQTAKSIRTYKTPYTNNHILNSLGMKICSQWFGDSELSLRLPNIFSFVFYVFFLFLLVRKISASLTIPIFLIAVLNPYLLDFFGLARGYGISIAFMVAAFWGLVNFLKEEKILFLVVFQAFAFLAIYANFSLIIYYLASLSAWYAIYIWKLLINPSIKKNPRFSIWSQVVNLLGGTWIVYAVWEPMTKILQKDMLNFGGKENFLVDTIGSLIPRLFYYEESMGMNPKLFLAWMVVMVLLIGLGIVVFILFTQKEEVFTQNIGLVLSNLTLVFIFLGSTLQHYLLHTDYLMERFALFLFPLFILYLGFLSEFLVKQRGMKIPILILTCTLALLTCLNTSQHLNPNFYLDWRYDMDTKNAFWTIRKDYELNAVDSCEEIELGVHWLFEPTMAYYRFTTQFWSMRQVDRNEIHLEDTYTYSFEIDFKNNGIPLERRLLYSKEVGTFLVKNRPFSLP